MKKNPFILMILFIASLLISCDKKDENTLSALVVIGNRYISAMETKGSQTIANFSRVQIEAIVLGTPFPSIDYIQLGDKKFNNPDNFYYGMGLTEYYDEVVVDDSGEIKLDPLKVIVKSSIGEIEGSVNLPDTLKTISVDAPDQISTGTPVKVTWSGSNADFYEVRYVFEFTKDEQFIDEVFMDTLVTSGSVTFEGSRFGKDGRIFDIRVRPLNGPIPVAGAKHNMNGDGFGYLIIQNESIKYDKQIIVGNGINQSSSKVGSDQTTELRDNSDLLMKIAERLGIKLDSF